MKPTSRALLGVSLALPFALLNMIVGKRIEPFLSWLRPTGHTSLGEAAAFLFVVALLLIGSLVSAQPLYQKEDGKRTFYPLNFVVSAVLLCMSVGLLILFFDEIYRCDVLLIANCD